MTDLLKKWQPLLEHAEVPEIRDNYRKHVTAKLLENQENFMSTQAHATGGSMSLTESETPANVAGNHAYYNPVLISLVRRAMPNLIAYDVAGVQPMTGPTGLVFALRSRYVDGTDPNKTLGNEAFYTEADTSFTGAGNHIGDDPNDLFGGTAPNPIGGGTDGGTPAVPATYDTGTNMATADAEKLGTTGGAAFAEMGFEMTSFSVTAGSRGLKAHYTVEMAQDLRNIHGLDAEAELASILSSEIIAEINREIIRTMYIVAKPGAQQTGLTTAGQFDLLNDSTGRWAAERFKSMIFQIDRDANAIAKDTRRGKGNFIICSSDVASALSIGGRLDNAPALSTTLQVDDTGNTFAGVLDGRYKVFIDPYANEDWYVVGYKGTGGYDAGFFYCPYVPLEMYKAVGEDSFQPRIGFKTRYGMVSAPFAGGATDRNGVLTANDNVYYRRVKVTNLLATA